MSSGQRDAVIVQIANELGEELIDARTVRRLVRTVWKRFGTGAVTVSIAIVADQQFRALNRKFLRRHGTSDCLSFDLSDPQADGGRRLFELVINGELAREQARCRGHRAEAEAALYIVHGLLHQMGFDDASVSQARQMHATEDQILTEFGYGPVYRHPDEGKLRKGG